MEFTQQEKDDIRFALVFTMKELDLNTGNSADKILSDRLEVIASRIDNE